MNDFEQLEKLLLKQNELENLDNEIEECKAEIIKNKNYSIFAEFRNILTYIFLTVFAVDLLDTVIHALGIRNISSKFMKLSEEISEFAIEVYSTVGGKSENESEAMKKELNEKFDDLRSSYDKFKGDLKDIKSKSKKRLFKAFPFLKDGLTKQDKLIEDLFADLKEKITGNK